MKVSTINNATNDLKDHVIGIMKVRDRFLLVCEYSEANQTVNVVRFTDFGVAIPEYSLPVAYAQSMFLFPDNKTMNQMLSEPFEWSEFISQFN